MRLKIFISISLLALLMNGCVIDRIKQRLYMKKQHKKIDVKKEDKEAKLYEPSKSPLLVEEIFLPIEEIPLEETSKSQVASNNTSAKKVKVAKAKVKKTNNKKKVHSVKKENLEPYSIEKNEEDPELLGPQTTLKSNPLTKVIKEESKKKI